MLSVSTLSELTTQCATRYYGPRTHSPATETAIGRRYSFKAELATGYPAVISR